MPNTKAVGVAYSDPEFESVTVTGAITSTSIATTGALTGASVSVTGALTGASVSVTGALNGTQLDLNAPVTKTASFTLADNENFVVCNGASANVTVTFPTASANIGRVVWLKNLSGTYTVISASSNVQPINSATAGTAILAASAGAWAMLVCNGTDWVVMAS
jgi:hypothetical protein